MKIRVLPTEEDFDLAVAWEITKQVIHKPDSLIGLSAGNTTHRVHRKVSEIYNAFPYDIKQARFFGIDEIVMLPQDFPELCITDFNRELFHPCGIAQSNILIPPSLSADYSLEAMKFGQRLQEWGTVDLLELGIGPDGHLAMNLPGSSFQSGTRFVMLSGELEERIRSHGGLDKDAPLGGITIGLKTLMNMPRIMLVAKGPGKSAILKQALQGEITEAVPASILQLHPNVEVILDSDAASMLS